MCDEFNMCEMEENEFDIDILKDGGGTCVLKNFPDLWENLLFLNLTAFETTLMDFEERFETSH